MRFRFYKQMDAMDCGPTCLRMIAKHYGKEYSLDYLRQQSYITREGVSLFGISEAAEKIGFRTLMLKLNEEQLLNDAPLPCILHWNQKHFVVLVDHKKKNGREYFTIADPAHGVVKISREVFRNAWLSTSDDKGIALVLEPGTDFGKSAAEPIPTKAGCSFLFKYVKPYRKYLVQLGLGLLLGSVFSLIFPFLTQGLVDQGINKNNMGFIYLVLISQLLLFIGGTVIEMIRSWLLLHMNSRISISIISDFLIKLMKLPIRFFDSRLVGDITQRINDHHRVEGFLTSTTLNVLFSFINLLVFSVVLCLYSFKIFFIFLVGSVLAIIWIFAFLKKRKEIDYKVFQQLGDKNSNLYELITGMQEIKLNNCETYRRWEWEKIQARLFKLHIQGLSLEQYQQFGSRFFTQLKNIIISVVAAQQVLDGNITLGMMLSISYIIGQMNGPIDQLIRFFQAAQDAKISLDRLSEIHGRHNEEPAVDQTTVADGKEREVRNADIVLEDVSFQYGGPHSPAVLNDISFTIPGGKVTAIVGASGGGKTTLLKLLLKFYEPVTGSITVGNHRLEDISAKWWRKQCGTVMQDGYIFSDTIARNIAVDGGDIDEEWLIESCRIANIYDHILSLPLGFNTHIGNAGSGLSAGQKQRILIARAVYKNPQFILFDEATSALDANNERTIIENLDRFFRNKTVLIIAHRLSTVRNADQIIVLNNGRIAEVGTHDELAGRKGQYYSLVKNQLELGA